MKTKILIILLISGLMSCDNSSNKSKPDVASGYTMDRTILPIHPPIVAPITEMDARNATKPERFEIKAPEGAPNVVVILIDDIGFGATSTFGGPIPTPAFDKLVSSQG